MNKIIIYDSDHPGASKNRCFEESYAREGPGHSFTVDLAREAKVRGYEIMTADVFLQRNFLREETIAYCITDMCSSKTNILLRNENVTPFLCMSTESPLIAKDFYIHIKKRAGRFRYNLQFRGTANRLSQTPTQFSTMYYPIDSRIPFKLVPWREKRYLTLINRNKRAYYANYDGVKNILRSFLSKSKLIIQKLIDPWMRSKEIYRDRIEAIHYFSKTDGFHLYGQGWENQIPGFSDEYHQAAKRCYKGSLNFDAKLKTMNQYKFAICFENCSFPGYVTEKIFDCFLAGCIPVYFGAPDINHFVPANSFIDFRTFTSFEELDSYLQSMNETTALKLLTAAHDFLSSNQFDKYFQPFIIRNIFNKLELMQQSNPELNT